MQIRLDLTVITALFVGLRLRLLLYKLYILWISMGAESADKIMLQHASLLHPNWRQGVEVGEGLL
jgi:hypothetical protein